MQEVVEKSSRTVTFPPVRRVAAKVLHQVPSHQDKASSDVGLHEPASFARVRVRQFFEVPLSGPTDFFNSLIGFRLSCHRKAFQKSRTAAEGDPVFPQVLHHGFPQKWE